MRKRTWQEKWIRSVQDEALNADWEDWHSAQLYAFAAGDRTTKILIHLAVDADHYVAYHLTL